MANVLEMVADIVSSHARTTPMTTDELLSELKTLYQAVEKLSERRGGLREEEFFDSFC